MFERLKRSQPVLDAPAPASNVAVLERPEPVTVTLDPLPDLSEYEEIAKVLGFEPPEIRKQKTEIVRRELIEFILDKGYPIYANDAVHKYMSALAEKDDRVFVWARLRGETDREMSARHERDSAQRLFELQMSSLTRMQNIVQTRVHGQFTNGYHRPVPIEMLKRAAEIKKKFDAAEFYVSDYAVMVPDPFIMVKLRDCEHVVFGVWDEPGFGMK